MKVSDDKASYSLELFLLRKLYSKMLDFLTLFFSVKIEKDFELDNHYQLLKNEISNLIFKKEFLKLFEERPFFFEDIYLNVKDKELMWGAFQREEMTKALSKIEYIFLKNGSKEFKVTRKLKDILSKIDNDLKHLGKGAPVKQSRDFVISIKDRSVLVNDKYLLSRPRSNSKLLVFLRYLMDNQNVTLKMTSPQIKEIIGYKEFKDIPYYLGFRGSLLPAFFPLRGETFKFRASISEEDLKKSGINKSDFIMELNKIEKARQT